METKATRKFKSGVNVETSRCIKLTIYNILNIALKKETIMIVDIWEGSPAWLTRAEGMVKISENNAQRKLNNQGFDIECLPANFPIIATNPKQNEAIQAKI